MTINQVAGGFQSSANITPAYGFQGDFATLNPRYSYPAGVAGLVADTTGVTVGAFAWLQTDGTTVRSAQNSGSPATTAPTGIVARELQTFVDTRTASYGNTIPGGWPVTVITSSDMLFVNSGGSAAVLGQKVFVLNSNGATAQTAAAGTVISNYIETDWVVTGGCAAGELMTISALTPVGAGTI